MPTFDREEIEAAKAVLDTRRLTMGERVQAFEHEFARWTGAKHAIMVNSGSSANLLMVDALLRRSNRSAPLCPGDEVLVPTLAWPTTVWPLVQLGLVPVFVDVNLQTLSIDLDSARSALSSKTKAVFLIHVLGQTADMDSMSAFCKETGLILLEDVCESLGAYYNGIHAGNFGVMGSFSSYFSHHISTIEGGVIITSDSALHDDLLSLRAHGWVRDRSDREEWIHQYPEIDSRFLFILPGYNVRPTEIQGAIGLVQLNKLESMLMTRERLAAEVSRLVNQYTPWMRLVGAEHLGAKIERSSSRYRRRHSWMTLPFILDKAAPLSLAVVKRHFERSGIETRPIIAGNLSRHPAVHHSIHRTASSLAKADVILDRGFMIGCHPINLEANLAVLENGFRSLAKLSKTESQVQV